MDSLPNQLALRGTQDRYRVEHQSSFKNTNSKIVRHFGVRLKPHVAGSTLVPLAGKLEP
jgi:hypothetical protein